MGRFLLMWYNVQNNTDYKYQRNNPQDYFLATVSGTIITMRAITMTIAHNQHPRHPQHQRWKHEQPRFNPRWQHRCVREFWRNQWHNRQHDWQHTAKQMWHQRRDYSDFNSLVFHNKSFDWRSHQDLNPDLILRRNSFYPVELWEHTSFILFLGF